MLRICAVGYGAIAGKHMQAFEAIGGVMPHTVVGRRAEPTKEFAARWRFEHWTLDLEEALAQSEIDAVVIASPSEHHSLQTEEALRAGKHVLVEIPLAMNLADAQRVTALAEEADRQLMVAHTLRYLPPFQDVKDRVAAGRLHLHHVIARIAFLRRENVGWTGRKRSWVDNLLWHHGCHVVDMALWLLGATQTADVWCQLGPPHLTLGTPMDLTLGIRTSAEQLISAALSYNSHCAVDDWLLIGEEETLSICDTQLFDARGNALGERVDRTNLTFQNAHFIQAVTEGHPSATSGEAVLPTMAALQQAHESATPRG